MAAVIGVGNRCLRIEEGRKRGRESKRENIEVAWREEGREEKKYRATKWKRTERRNACRGTS